MCFTSADDELNACTLMSNNESVGLPELRIVAASSGIVSATHPVATLKLDLITKGESGKNAEKI